MLSKNEEVGELTRNQFRVIADSIKQYVTSELEVPELAAGIFAANLTKIIEKPILKIIEANERHTQ